MCFAQSQKTNQNPLHGLPPFLSDWLKGELHNERHGQGSKHCWRRAVCRAASTQLLGFQVCNYVTQMPSLPSSPSRHPTHTALLDHPLFTDCCCKIQHIADSLYRVVDRQESTCFSDTHTTEHSFGPCTCQSTCAVMYSRNHFFPSTTSPFTVKPVHNPPILVCNLSTCTHPLLSRALVES